MFFNCERIEKEVDYILESFQQMEINISIGMRRSASLDLIVAANRIGVLRGAMLESRLEDPEHRLLWDTTHAAE